MAIPLRHSDSTGMKSSDTTSTKLISNPLTAEIIPQSPGEHMSTQVLAFTTCFRRALCLSVWHPTTRLSGAPPMIPAATIGSGK
jgi:hypothetical protein